MKLRAHLLITVAALAIAAPADAIVGGQADGSDHGYVAAIGQPDGGGIVFTGVAISPTVVLTVAHGAIRLVRATGSDQARVTFDPVAGSSATWYTGTIHIDPAYNHVVGSHDLAVVTFASPLPIAPASVPPAGHFDEAEQSALVGTAFDVVGYGVTGFQGGTAGGGRPAPDFSSGGTRKIDREFYVSTESTWLRFRLPAGDQLCPGDSGSPTLVAHSSLIAGISLGSFGGCWSSSSATDMRVDTASAREFIGQYVTLP